MVSIRENVKNNYRVTFEGQTMIVSGYEMGYRDAAEKGVIVRLREQPEWTRFLERVMSGADVRIFGVVMTDGRMIRVAVQKEEVE